MERGRGVRLRAYLAWAARQGDESTRVSEAILPETDADSVRIMTVQRAKGLEFPIVIVSGLSTLPQWNRGRDYKTDTIDDGQLAEQVDSYVPQ